MHKRILNILLLSVGVAVVAILTQAAIRNFTLYNVNVPQYPGSQQVSTSTRQLAADTSTNVSVWQADNSTTDSVRQHFSESLTRDGWVAQPSSDADVLTYRYTTPASMACTTFDLNLKVHAVNNAVTINEVLDRRPCE